MKYCFNRFIGCFPVLFIFSISLPFSASAQESMSIEEVVVTARKREESAQDVPVAIQAFQTETIERYGATNLNEIADLATQVAVYPGSSGNGANMTIRGYGSTSLDPGIESSVGVNIDGVQTDRGHVVRQAFFDLQTVEVLKGPQALFFGKNSPAGVISAVSALPTDEFEAEIAIGYETQAEEKILEFMVSGPLSEELSARLAYRGSFSEGWIENTATFKENSNGELFPAEPFDFPGGASDLGAEDLHAVRVTFDWHPSDDFQAILKVLSTSMENDGYQTNENNACSNDFPITQGVLDLEGDCELNNRQSHGSLPIEIASTYSIDIGNGDPYGDYDSILATLQLEWELGWATLTSVTGYYDYDYERWDNFDGTNFIQLMGIQLEDQQQISQEIRLLTTLDQSVNFMVGGFYENFERNSDNAGKIAALGFDPIFGFSNTWEGISTVDSDSFSFFAQAIWELSDEWELTAGARYTKDDKKASQENVYVHFIFGPAVLNILSPVGRQLLSDFDDTNVSPEVTLTWRPSSDITVWGAYRAGYKSGGFSTNTVLSSAATGPGLTFNPEEADGFEMGIKSTLADGRLRLNATIYSYDFDDIQISVFDAATTSFSVDNAASAKTDGIEIESIYLVNEYLSVRAQLGYNKGEYDQFATSACYGGQTAALGCVGGVQDLSGEPLTRSPDLQGSVGFEFSNNLTDDWLISLAGEVIYSDEYQTNTNNNPLGIQDSFTRTNIRAAISSADGAWNFALMGRNISDELYQGGTADKPGAAGGLDLFGNVVRGRQIILEAKYSFN